VFAAWKRIGHGITKLKAMAFGLICQAVPDLDTDLDQLLFGDTRCTRVKSPCEPNFKQFHCLNT
jgi:hypothetical protein